MKEIELFNRKGIVVGKAMVDDEDYDIVNTKRWFMVTNGNNQYAQCSLTTPNKKTIQMHRFILGEVAVGKITDHKDGNGLNNQRSNLRTCSTAENCRNRKGIKNTSSIYKGVSLVTYRSTQIKKDGTIANYSYTRWRVMININGKNVGLCSFNTEEEAAIVYDAAAKEFHKEFANLNFPNKKTPPLEALLKTKFRSQINKLKSGC